jgi:hypothetical protein
MPISIRERRDRRTTLLSPLELNVDLGELVAYVPFDPGDGDGDGGDGGGGDGGGDGDGGFSIASITYSQSGVYLFPAPSDNTGMTDGEFAKEYPGGQTAIEASAPIDDPEPEAWLLMDLGEVRSVGTVVVGSDFDETLQRGEGWWGKEYAEDLDVSYSVDGIDFEFAFNTGTFTEGIQSYPVDFSARFILIEGKLEEQLPGIMFRSLAVTQFYAEAPGCDPSLASITYDQSGVATFQAAATNGGMTDGVFDKVNPGGQTAHEVVILASESDDLPEAWLQMDLGSVVAVTSVVIGCDFNAALGRVNDYSFFVPGNDFYGKSYAEYLDVSYSEDGVTFTFAFNTGEFTEGIQTYPVDFNARFIRIDGWLRFFGGD